MTQIRQYVADMSNLDAAMPNLMVDTADDRLHKRVDTFTVDRRACDIE